MTTGAEIDRWFDEGQKTQATHLIVVVDTFDYGNYPVYAWSDQDAVEKYDRYNNHNMQRVMEVYNLKHSKDAQMREHCAMHLP